MQLKVPRLGFVCLLAVVATWSEASADDQLSPSKPEKVESSPFLHLLQAGRIDDGGLPPLQRQKRTFGKWFGHGGGGCGNNCGGGGGGVNPPNINVIVIREPVGRGNAGGQYPRRGGGGCGSGGCGGGGSYSEASASASSWGTGKK